MEKVCVMKLSTNLSHKLWREIVAAIIYLYNRISQALNNWISLYEAFYIYVFEKEKVSNPYKPYLHQLRAYSCKVYILIKSKSDAQYRYKRQKHDAKIHIGFMIGYESTNIYRIWISIKKKVVSVRDVIFDEDTI